jgi:uncharacterized membrane protein
MKKVSMSYPQILTGAAAVGLIASFWQAAERIQMLKYPAVTPSCNLSPVVECSGVLNDRLAAVFGPPNAFIGMVVFALLLAFGLQRLTGGTWTSFVRKTVLALSALIFLFSVWFFWVSLFVIGKVCIFCVFIWAMSMPIGVYGLKDFLDGSKKLTGFWSQLRQFLSRNHLNLLIGIYGLLIVTFLIRFRDYYFG